MDIKTQVEGGLDALAERFGVPLTELYAVMIRKAWAKAVICAVFIVIGAVLAGLFCLHIYAIYGKKDENGKTVYDRWRWNDKESALFTATIAFAVVAVVTLTIALCYVETLLQCVLNPEYYAIKELLSQMK